MNTKIIMLTTRVLLNENSNLEDLQNAIDAEIDSISY